MQMKQFIVGLVLVIGVALHAQPVGDTSWSSKGTALSSNVSWVAASPVSGLAPTVVYANVTCDSVDLATNLLKWYSFGAAVPVTTAQSAATNIITLGSGHGVASNAIVVFFDKSLNQAYRRTIVTSLTTTVTVDSNLSAAAAIGDQIYVATLAASVPACATALTPQEFMPTSALFFGSAGKPALIEVLGVGTNTVAINAVGIKYVRP